MNSANEDKIYLTHILLSISKIEEYTKEISYEKFSDSSLIQDGVIRQLLIIGEATKHLSKTITETNLHIDWKDIAGMRDKLIHDYFGVDIEIIWQTLIEDIPFLKTEVNKILSQ